MQDATKEDFGNSIEKTRAAEDVLLPQPIPQAEYMYGCTPTAVAMLLGYYDLFGYRDRDFSNLIDGDVQLNERGTDGDAYNMNAFDTTLGRTIATEDYVWRFYERDGAETTPEQELEYSFTENGNEVDISVWNCLADYLGTGQYWRGMSNRATRIAYTTLEELSLTTRMATMTGDGYTREVEEKFLSFLYGLQLYVQSRGYSLDYEVTGSYQVDVNHGNFTFADYKAEIDAGRPVLVSITGHTMVGYGYNDETQEIIFDNMYRSDCRMTWGGSYFYSGMERELVGITTIGLVYGDLNCDLSVDNSTNNGIIVSNKTGATADADYLVANDKLFVNFSVKNEGSEGCGPFDVSVYLDGELVKSLAVDSLNAGERFSFRNESLDTLAAGTHVLKVVVDDGNLVQEISGLNNSLEKKVFVFAKTPTVISTSTTIGVGKSLDNLFMKPVNNRVTLDVKGGRVSNGIVQGKVLDYNPATGQYGGYFANVQTSGGGVATDLQIYEFGTLVIGNGGLAENVDVYELGEVVLQDGGVWRGGRIESGGMLTLEGGTVKELEILHDVTIVTNAGLFSDTFVEGSLWLQGESAGENITVGKGGTVTAVNGRHIEGAVVTAGGLLDLRTSSTVTNLRVENGADVKCSYSIRLLGELTLAGTLGTLGTFIGDCVSEVDEFVFIVTEDEGYGSLQFYDGGFAANAVITIDMENVEGDFALAYGRLANLSSATITVKRGGEARQLGYKDKKVWSDGNRVSLEADGNSWMLRVVPCLSNVTVAGPTTQARISVSFNCVEEMTERFYSWNGGEWTAFTGERLFFTENGTIQLKLLDEEGVAVMSDLYELDGFNILLTGLEQVAPESGTANALLSWETEAAWVDLCDLALSLDGKQLLLEGLSDWNVELHAPSVREATWRVKPVQSDIWTEAEQPIQTEMPPQEPQQFQAEENGRCDVMLARANGLWQAGFVAHYVGVETLKGTVKNVSLAGMNRINDAFWGSTDATRLYLTDDANGDALFVEDLYSEQPVEWEVPQSRIIALDEVFAGAGNDVVDLTSEVFLYGDTVTVHGGDGNDFLWGGSGSNLLFGDEGDDQLVGAYGDDLLAGGTGDDIIYGGGGDDLVAFCADWGTDEVVQQPGGTIKLWFESGSLDNWDAENLTYRDGSNSVTVSGIEADAISLEFGDNNGLEEYARLASISAFAPYTSRTIFNGQSDGYLA